MGLFDFAKKKKAADKKLNHFYGLGWTTPLFSQFGTDIYASDVVLQAVACIVKEMKKLDPLHIIRGRDNYRAAEYDDIHRALHNPNELMTTADLIEKITWLLYANCNVFVFPQWENDTLAALFPLNPTTVEFLQDAAGKMFVNFIFPNGLETTIRYSDVIHIRKDYSMSEFMGGNAMGQPDNSALLKSLDLNHKLLQGVSKALEAGFAVNGIIKYNTVIDQGKAEKEMEKLQEYLNNNKSGFMPLDMKADFVQFQRSLQLVDETTLRFIDEKILRHFGVPLCILKGDYTKTQYEAFFQSTIEPLIVAYNQAFTKALFSTRMIEGYGHEIMFTHNMLDFMTMSEKATFVNIAMNTGAITVDEIRSVMGLIPYGDELGRTPIMSKNYGNAWEVKNLETVKNMASDKLSQ